MLHVPSSDFILSDGAEARHQGGVEQRAAVGADLARGHHRLLRRSQPVVINCSLLSTLCPDTEPASPSPTWPIIAGAVFGAVAIIGILILIFLKIRKMEMALRQANLQ